MRGRSARISSSLICSQSTIGAGWVAFWSEVRMSLQSATHSLQMYTPGPAMTFSTSSPRLPQNVQWIVSVDVIGPPAHRSSEQPQIAREPGGLLGGLRRFRADDDDGDPVTLPLHGDARRPPRGPGAAGEVRTRR